MKERSTAADGRSPSAPAFSTGRGEEGVTIGNQRVKQTVQTRRMFLTFLLSYLLILAVALFAGSVVYVNAIRIIRSQEENAKVEMLRQVSQTIDMKIQELNAIAVNAATSQSVQSFLTVRAQLNESSRYQVFNVIETLQTLRNSNNFMREIFIYFKNSDLVLSSSSMNTPEFFYNTVFSYEGLGLDEWREQLLSGRGGKCYPVAGCRLAGKETRVLTLMQNAPITQRSAAVVVFILVEEEKIESLMGGLPGDGSIAVSDAGGREILSMGSAGSEGEQEGYSVTRISAGGSGWSYVYSTPQSAYMEQAKSIQRMAVLVMGASVFVGLCLAFLLAKNNYSPIRQIMDLLGGIQRPEADLSRGEAEYIKFSISQVLDRYAALESSYADMDNRSRLMEERFRQTAHALRDSFTADLIRGRFTDSQATAELIRFHEMFFDTDRFIVALFQVDPPDGAGGGEAALDGLLPVLRSSLEERLSHLVTAYAAPLEGEVVGVLLNLKTEDYPGDILGDLCTASQKLQQVLCEYKKLRLTVGVGNVCKGLCHLGVSYQQAGMALDYRLVRGQMQTIAYRSVVRQGERPQRGRMLSANMEAQLVNCVRAGDRDQCAKLLESIFRERYRADMDIRYAKCLMFDQIGLALRVLDEIDLRYSEIPGVHADPVELLLRCKSLEDIHRTVSLLFDSICAYIGKTRGSKRERLKNDLIQYIDRCYGDPNLSQAAIAGHFGITPQYLSKFFKQATGKNMVEYIHERRIACAKKLLKEGKLPISEIASRTGFSNVRHLDRVFKRCEGVAPGQYREALEQKDEKENEKGC